MHMHTAVERERVDVEKDRIDIERFSRRVIKVCRLDQDWIETHTVKKKVGKRNLFIKRVVHK